MRSARAGRAGRIGAHGNPTSFSFHATKNITTFEGGALAFADEGMAQRAERLSLHGLSRSAWARHGATGPAAYEVAEPGLQVLDERHLRRGRHPPVAPARRLDRAPRRARRPLRRGAARPPARPPAAAAGPRPARAPPLHRAAPRGAPDRSRQIDRGDAATRDRLQCSLQGDPPLRLLPLPLRPAARRPPGRARTCRRTRSACPLFPAMSEARRRARRRHARGSLA